MPRTYIVGRDPACDIQLADETVSRRHAELVLRDDGRLDVRDLGSTRGTRVERSAEWIQVGDAATEVGDEVEFGELRVPRPTLVDMRSAADGVAAALLAGRRQPATPAPAPAGPSTLPASGTPGPAVSSEPTPADHRPEDYERVLPMALGTGGLRRLWERNLIIPPLATVVLFMILLHGLQRWGNQPNDVQRIRASIDLMNEVGVALVMAAFYAVYRLCGKRKAVLALLAIAAGEYVIFEYLDAPYLFVFRTLTNARAMMASTNPLSLFLGYFFGAGLMEELMKITPVLVLMAVVARLQPASRKRWEVIEPLDAILYAAAAASVFIMLETLGQYVPRAVARGLWNPAVFAKFLQSMPEAGKEVLGAFPVLQKYVDQPKVLPPVDLLLATYATYPRLLNVLGIDPGYAAFRAVLVALLRTVQSLSGHIAYSVYFGYFVGLAAMRPSRRTRLFLTGWLGAALIHGAYDALPDIIGSSLMSGVMSAVAVFFLVVVIAAARKISPTRADNFATRWIPSNGISSGTTPT